jgi:3D-(3,5/4)-trihydroxycyclohexane-1,2-dione acylhydrolase (decyclizing)
MGKGPVIRLTVAQAVVRFLASQHSERDGATQRLIPGCFGIFGHGNVAGIGQAVLEAQQGGPADLRYYLARNEQAMVHASVGFARMRNRLQALACTASIGPGSTNMVTGAALATINRIPVLLAAMRVLTDPAETGAVTLALPQDVQAEAFDWPGQLFAEQAGIHVADTQAGKGALPWDHPLAAGGIGATGSPVANALARDADVVLGIGTRYSDFTTASRTAFGHPGVAFINLNITSFDASKHAGASLVADARAGLEALAGQLAGHRAGPAWAARVAGLDQGWRRVVDRADHLGHQPKPAQTEVIGALNEFLDDRDVVVQAAGSMPGDLQMLWRARDPKQYHVEYGYSRMGYEIAGGLGAKLADPSREVFVLNHGFASIGALSQAVGSQRFGAPRKPAPLTPPPKPVSGSTSSTSQAGLAGTNKTAGVKGEQIATPARTRRHRPCPDSPSGPQAPR